MFKKEKRVDLVQLALNLDRQVEEFRGMKEILKERPAEKLNGYEEACIQIAASIKMAIRISGLSREHVVDDINRYFGWPTIEEYQKLKELRKIKQATKHLSIHMLNHYLSKPVAYPIPAYLIYPIQKITKSLEPCRALAEAEDARVISGDEVRHMTMGKLDETILEMQRLKRELRGGR